MPTSTDAHGVLVAIQLRLTDREQEILKLMIEGQSNAEIAAALYLSPNTVKSHVKGIFNKFGVDHRVQAAVFALRHGLV